MRITASKIAATAALGLLVTLAVGSQAWARNIDRGGSYQTGRDRTGAYHAHVRGDYRHGLSRQQSITTQGGRTFSRSSTASYDRDSGAFSRSVSGPRGGSRSVAGTALHGQFSGTYSTSGGRSGGFQGSTTRNEDGSLTRSGTYTNASGDSGEFTRTRSPGEDGSLSRASSLTTPDSRTYARSVDSALDGQSRTLTRTVTGPNGEERTGSVTLTPEP